MVLYLFALEVENVIAGYQEGIDILKGITLSANEHGITSIIGANGAGKSTLLKCIYGFIKPRAGRILYCGKDISDLRPFDMAKNGLAYLTQLRSVFPYLTVKENLELGMWIYGSDSTKTSDTMEKTLKIFPLLRPKLKKKAGDLSGGEQRLLELARALMTEPRVMLIDEPTAGLAPKVSGVIYKYLAQLRDDGLTALIVDQHVRTIVEISDHVYVIDMGKVSQHGSRLEMIEKCESLIRQTFTLGTGQQGR